MISNPHTDIPDCVIWLDAADTSTLGTSIIGPGPVADGDFIRYWQNKANPSKSFIQNSTSTISPPLPTYYASLSAINLENQYTSPFLRYSATPGNEFIFNKQITTIMLCSITQQIATNTHRNIFELSAAGVQYPTNAYVPLMLSDHQLGWTGEPDTFWITVGSGINRNEVFIPGIRDERNNYFYQNACTKILNISQNISEAYMLTSRLSDNFLVNFEGLNRTNALSSDTILLNHWQVGSNPTGILNSTHTTIGNFKGAIYEILVYNRALTFDELNNIQNYFYRKWTPVGVKIKRDIYPENSGNWSSINWSIDTEPTPWNNITPTDKVFTNEGYTVHIDTNVHVNSIVNKKIKDINNIFNIGKGNNGTFNITNNVSITADIVNTSSDHYFITLSPSVTSSITGSFYGETNDTVQIFLGSQGKYLGAQDRFNPNTSYESQLRNYLISQNLVEGANNNSIDYVTSQSVFHNKIFTLSAAGNCSLTINGDITSTTRIPKYIGYAGQGYRPVFWNSSAPLFLNGDIIMRGIIWNSGSPVNLNRVYHIVTSGPLYMKGNIYHSRLYNQIYGTWNFGVSTSNVMYLTGNVYGGTGQDGIGIINSNGNLYINGNLEIDYGSPANGTRAVIATNNSKTFINGDIFGPKAAGGVDTNTTGYFNVFALDLLDNSYAFVLGNVYGGVGNTVCAGINVQNTASLLVSGDVLPNVGPGIYSTSTSAVSVCFINDGFNYSGGQYSVPAILANKLFVLDSNNISKKFTKLQKNDGSEVFYRTNNLSFSYPPSADVQFNLIYGPLYSLSGSMIIPETSAVGWNIPVRSDIKMSKLKKNERYEIISVDPFFPFTDFGADSDIPGVTFSSTKNSNGGGSGIARPVGKSVITTVDIMSENINNLSLGSNNNPTLRTYLQDITHIETLSSIAKSYRYSTF